MLRVLRRRWAEATQGRAEIVAQICALLRSGEGKEWSSGVVELLRPCMARAVRLMLWRPVEYRHCDKAMAAVSFQAGVSTVRWYLAEVMLG